MKDRLSELYADHHQQKGRYEYLFCHGERGPFLKEWIGEGKKVLDLGCRDGKLTEFFARGNVVVGVDIDQNALEKIQKRLNIETHWLDLNSEWPFKPESFDCIVACEILEHVFFLGSLLDQIEKSLKKGGLFIGSVPNSFRLRNRWKFLLGKEFDNDPTHVRLFSYGKLERMLSSRFSQIEIVPIRSKVGPSSSKIITKCFAKDLLWLSKKGLEGVFKRAL